jgi:predicted transcriptional regulator
MVERERTGRAWSYRPAASREAFIAQLMLDALDLAGSRDAALVRFARSVSGTEAEVLRAALAGHSQPETSAPAAGPATGDGAREDRKG